MEQNPLCYLLDLGHQQWINTLLFQRKRTTEEEGEEHCCTIMMLQVV